MSAQIGSAPATVAHETETPMSLPTEPTRLVLPDGRDLAFLEVGDATGRPVLFFHGGADSRLESHLIAAAAAAHGIRLIAPERPGFGASSPDPTRTLTSWSADVVALADHLDLAHFDVMGHSAGGVFALATAAALPGRVEQAIVVAGPAPRAAGARGMSIPFRMARFFALVAPSLHRMLLRRHQRDLEDPAGFIAQYGGVSPGDQALFEADPAVGEWLVADMVEGYRQGIASASHEAGLYFDRWDFALSSVSQPVYLYVGTADPNVAPGWGRWLADALPRGELVQLPGEGHISALVRHAGAMFDRLGRVG